jgi:hypothetical protein
MMGRFELSESQMQILIGPASIPSKLKSLVSHSIADGIAD